MTKKHDEGIPRLKNGKYWIKGNWALIMQTLLEFPEMTAPSIRELAIRAGKGAIHWGIINRWKTIPEAFVSRTHRGTRIELKLTDLGLKVITDLNLQKPPNETSSGS
jgi:hypothetical protein